MQTTRLLQPPKNPIGRESLKLYFLKLTHKNCQSLWQTLKQPYFLRFQSLGNSPDKHVERDALSDAIRTLRAIQTGKLHYHDPEFR
jgi:hypothetical protein